MRRMRQIPRTVPRLIRQIPLTLDRRVQPRVEMFAQESFGHPKVFSSALLFSSRSSSWARDQRRGDGTTIAVPEETAITRDGKKITFDDL